MMKQLRSPVLIAAATLVIATAFTGVMLDIVFFTFAMIFAFVAVKYLK